MKTLRNCFLTLAPLLALAVSARAAETNDVGSVLSRLHFSAFADIQSSYWARGVIVDENPFSAQYVSLDADLRPFVLCEGQETASPLSEEGRPEREKAEAMRKTAKSRDSFCAYLLVSVVNH